MAELGAIGTDDKEEHFNLGPPGMQFIENYIPMYREGRLDQQVLGVAEIYRTPAKLLDVIRTGEWMIFAVAALGALLIVGTLCWLVGYADRVIRRQNVAIAESSASRPRARWRQPSRMGCATPWPRSARRPSWVSDFAPSSGSCRCSTTSCCRPIGWSTGSGSI